MLQCFPFNTVSTLLVMIPYFQSCVYKSFVLILTVWLHLAVKLGSKARPLLLRQCQKVFYPQKLGHLILQHAFQWPDQLLALKDGPSSCLQTISMSNLPSRIQFSITIVYVCCMLLSQYTVESVLLINLCRSIYLMIRVMRIMHIAKGLAERSWTGYTRPTGQSLRGSNLLMMVRRACLLLGLCHRTTSNSQLSWKIHQPGNSLLQYCCQILCLMISDCGTFNEWNPFVQQESYSYQ